MSTWIWIAICGAAFFIGVLLGDNTEDNILKDNNERLVRDALKYHIDMTVDIFDILDATIEGEKNREIIGVCRRKLLMEGKKDEDKEYN